MKKLFLILFLFIGGLKSVAQEITYSLTIRHTDCNDANNGRVKVTITSGTAPFTFLWNTGSTSQTINDLAAGNYSVMVSDSSGLDTTITVVINVIPCVISPAMVFTPNGDGINDYWGISNIGHYERNYILVYNRWGQKVFEHNGLYEEWDGRDLFGVPLPDNSYFYIIYGDKEDDSTIIKGTVSIIR